MSCAAWCGGRCAAALERSGDAALRAALEDEGYYATLLRRRGRGRTPSPSTDQHGRQAHVWRPSAGETAAGVAAARQMRTPTATRGVKWLRRAAAIPHPAPPPSHTPRRRRPLLAPASPPARRTAHPSPSPPECPREVPTSYAPGWPRALAAAAVGYCQSMNFLAATLLLFMEEQHAFWCLAALVELVLPPGFYSSQLHGVTIELRLLTDLLSRSPARCSPCSLCGHLGRDGLLQSRASFPRRPPHPIAPLSPPRRPRPPAAQVARVPLLHLPPSRA